MKLIPVLLVCMVLASNHVLAGEKMELNTQKDKLSYAIGMDMGSRMKKNAIDIDLDLVMRGLKDGFSANKSLMTDEEVKTVLMDIQKDLQAKQLEQRKALGEKNKKEGEAFLAENRKKEGVKALPSGLLYKVLSEGKGEIPKATDTVKVNYRGTLIDGTEFDSSYKRGQPATFPVNGVIKGWTEALQLMKPGATWQLFIPSDLAYGDRGAPGGLIGPNAALIFEVELIMVNPLDRHKKGQLAD